MLRSAWFATVGIMLLPLLASASTPGSYQHKVYSLRVEQQSSYEAQRRFSGRALAAQRAELGFELAGQIASIAVVEGQRVEQGQPLVSLDTRLLEVEQAQLQAQHEEIRARLGQAQRELKRQRRLKGQGYSAQQRIDDLASEERVLQAQLRQNQARIDGLAVRLEKSVLRAPFAGEVARLDAELGIVVGPGTPLLRLVEVENNEALIGIPESLRSSVTEGDSIAVSGDFGQVMATVLSISSTVNPGTLTHTVRLQLPANLQVADSSIVYMFLNEKRTQDGFWLPLDSLVQGFRGTWAVFALNAEGTGRYRLEKRSVVPVHQQGDRVFVKAGLGDGDLVVAGGVHRLAPGQLVVLQ